MEKSEQLDQLFTALAQAQSEIKHATMDCINPHYKNKYASLKSLVDVAKPVLAKYGLTVVQLAGPSDQRSVSMTTVIGHKSGQYIAETSPMPTKSDNPQSVGSSLTYARRYGLAAALGIVSDEDDDANLGAGKPALPPDTQYNPDVDEHKLALAARLSATTIPQKPEWGKISAKLKGRKFGDVEGLIKEYMGDVQ